MKKPLFLILFLLLAVIAKAQKPTDTSSLNELNTAQPANPPLIDTNQIFTAVEYEPTFPGGDEKFRDYIHQYIKQNFFTLDTKGVAIVNFIVNKDGSLSDVQVLKASDKQLVGPAAAIIKNSPKWNPGIQNGRATRVYFTVRIAFGDDN